MEEVLEKIGLSSFFAMAAIHFRGAMALLWLYVFFQIADFLSGMAAAIKNKELSKDKSDQSAIKKVGCYVIVGVAFGVDMMVAEIGIRVGLQDPIMAFGKLALCYMITGEAISILENLDKLGIEAPLLSKAIKSVHSKLDEKGETPCGKK